MAEKQSINWNLLLTVAAIGGGIYIVDKIIGSTSNLFNSSDSQTVLNSYNNNQAWDPNYYKNYTGQHLLFTQAAAANFADELHSQFSWNLYVINSASISEIMSILSNVKTKTQMSQLCDVYQQTYGDGLFQIMSDYLNGDSPIDSDNYMLQVVNYVNKLPDAVAS